MTQIAHSTSEVRELIAEPEDRSVARSVYQINLGILPGLCFSNSLILIVLALANTVSRNNNPIAPALLWFSLLAIFVPTALRLVSIHVPRLERIGLVVLLGCSLYMVKIMHSPLDFTFHDEFLHWQTVKNIVVSGQLFTQNPILPVSPLYPGLENITAALASLSGLSVVDSGMIVLGVARIGFMLALFLFYERIGGSARLGGIAALLYTANSNFIFFDSQFSYESLSLPIATAILYAVASRDDGYESNFWQKLLLPLPLICLVAITHHITGYVLAAFLTLWTVLSFFRRSKRWSWISLGAVAAMTMGLVLSWNSLIGETTSGYLLPVFINGITEALEVVFGGGGRQLFQNAAGGGSPIWERFVGIASVIGIVSLLPVGVLQIFLSPFRQRPLSNQIAVLSATTLHGWRHYRNSAAALLLAFIVMAHPPMQVFRLTSSGWEIANRSSEFLFWAIAFVLGVAVVYISSFKIPKYVWMVAFAVWASILFVGGATSGWPPWARQPGPYLVSADSRSVEPESIQAAKWADVHLPDGSRMSADRINNLLMTVYGNQHGITHLADDIYLASVFFNPTLGPTERQLMTTAQVDYMLVDMRLTEQLPMVGVYFEGGEPRPSEKRTPLSVEALAKFDNVDNMSRLFDSGHIRIYDAGAIRETH
jgi:hypothetical protein